MFRQLFAVGRSLALGLACLAAMVPAGVSAQGTTYGFSGQVVHDMNGDGKWTAGEPVAANTLVRVSGPSLEWVYTNGSGIFEVSGLRAGSYVVRPMTEGDVVFPKRDYKVVLPAMNGRFIRWGVHKKCFELLKPGLDIQETTMSGCYRMKGTFKNVTSSAISTIYFTQNAPVLVYPVGNPASQNMVGFSPPIPPGGTFTLDLMICNVAAGTMMHLPFMAVNPEHHECCEGMIDGIEIPMMRCLEVRENRAVCRPGGGYNWLLSFRNISGKLGTQVKFSPVYNATGNIVGYVNPSQINGTFSTNGVYTFNTVITGPPGGSVVFVDVLLYGGYGNLCCFERVAITLPNCNECIHLPGRNASGIPNYEDGSWDQPAFANTVIAVTHNKGDQTTNLYPDDYALTYFGMSGYQTNGSLPLGNRIQSPPPARYDGPPDPSRPGSLWKQRYLGAIFGLTIDGVANTYVTHTAVYGLNFFWGSVNRPGERTSTEPSPGAPRSFGLVLKVDGNLGRITEFARLPQQGSPSAGLGNITWDYDHNTFWVSNFEDGMIYRVQGDGKISTGVVAASATIAQWGVSAQNTDWYRPSYVASTTTPSSNPVGLPPLGQRTFGVQYHQGRLYFAQWSRDSVGSATNWSNDIWSVAIDSAGRAVPSTERIEPIDWSLLQRTQPISDISFSPEGYMGVTEMTIDMVVNGQPKKYSHQSSMIEFRCDEATMTWRPLLDNQPIRFTAFKIGPAALNGYLDYDTQFSVNWFRSYGNSNGGLDYDYFSGAAPGRVWATSAAANADFFGGPPPFPNAWNPTFCVYGLSGFPRNGGRSWAEAPGATPDTMLIDYDDSSGYFDKWFFGDVEIPRPNP